MTHLDTIVHRCGDCGSWKMTQHPCPACSPDAEPFRSHAWREPTPAEIPQCDACGTKMIHAAAWWQCPETIGGPA